MSDLDRSRRFYDAALRPLGLVRVADAGNRGSAYGAAPGPAAVQLAITRESGARTSPGLHLAFTARDRAAVKAFHLAALAEGGTDEGSPGPRTAYHPDYYAAYVTDPDGHRIEAVCHAPTRPEREA